MNIPGANILKMAFQVIAQQTVVYIQATGRALNTIGQDVTAYAPPVNIRGNFQPVPRKLYIQYGLDLQKSYWTFYTLTDLTDIERDISADQIVFNNMLYQCESNNDWYAIDGWKGVLCCELKPLNNSQNSYIFGFGTDPQSSSNLNFNNANFNP